MIELAHWPGFLAGMFAGCCHATLLWQGVHQLTAWTPLIGIARLAIVACVLIVAAWYGQILLAAVGWLIGFAATAGFSLWRPALKGPADEVQSHDKGSVTGCS